MNGTHLSRSKMTGKKNATKGGIFLPVIWIGVGRKVCNGLFERISIHFMYVSMRFIIIIFYTSPTKKAICLSLIHI